MSNRKTYVTHWKAAARDSTDLEGPIDTHLSGSFVCVFLISTERIISPLSLVIKLCMERTFHFNKPGHTMLIAPSI